MGNRNGLAVNARITQATGKAERRAAIDMLGELPGRGRVTVGGEKTYDTREFVEQTRNLNATPHVAQNTSRWPSAIDNRTTRHAGYAVQSKETKTR